MRKYGGKKMKIKLVACDLDGTLLNDNGEVSKENLDAIRALFERGIYFVPASGRAYGELIPPLSENPYIRYYALSSGANLYDKESDLSESVSLPRDVVSRAMEIFAEHEFFSLAHIGKECAMSAEALRKTPLVYGYLRDLFLSVGLDMPNYEEDIKKSDSVDMLCAVFDSAEALDDVVKRVGEIPNVEIATGTLGRGVYNIEICAVGADKGSAVARLADRLGISYDEVAVIGDSGNDYSMISKFKNSFAVKNARSIIKNAANYELCSNNEHAIAYLLKNFVED
jgi:Cof subfamily protein (haloacid dehalogenase superfamily)